MIIDPPYILYILACFVHFGANIQLSAFLLGEQYLLLFQGFLPLFLPTPCKDYTIHGTFP